MARARHENDEPEEGTVVDQRFSDVILSPADACNAAWHDHVALAFRQAYLGDFALGIELGLFDPKMIEEAQDG
ncbi:MAG: hypothetical protein OXC65_03185 [Thiotrichales bacterium]|nr:hypothetical protein [Thiotrichales bacterium]